MGITTVNRSHLSQLIDHTLLAPETTSQDVERHIHEALDLGVFGICVSPCFFPLAAEGLTTMTVVGFPFGTASPEAKAAEAAKAVADGAMEIETVMNLGRAKASQWNLVTADIAAVRAAIPDSIELKVIIESAALTDAHIVAACWAAEDAGANWVKTSTGFHPAGGATPQAVALIARTLAGHLKVKASGGIGDLATAIALLEAGAERLGTSHSAAILAEAQ